jgi:hypothetical protein
MVKQIQNNEIDAGSEIFQLNVLTRKLISTWSQIEINFPVRPGFKKISSGSGAWHISTAWAAHACLPSQ